jgi:hypothetical protein
MMISGARPTPLTMMYLMIGVSKQSPIGTASTLYFVVPTGSTI